MCPEPMDTNSKHIVTDNLRKIMKTGSKLRLKLSRVSAEEHEALQKQCRGSGVVVRTTIRKYLRREQRRVQRAKLAQILGDMMGKKEEERESVVCEESPAAACMHRHQPSGAMAPQNTTQYLMGNVYEDMKTNYNQTVTVSHETSAQLSDESCKHLVNASLDSDYESCLAFQQRDFEEVFRLYW